MKLFYLWLALGLCVSHEAYADEQYQVVLETQKTKKAKQNKKINLYNHIQSLPVEINQIVKRCPWRSKKGKGVVRVIHTTVGLSNELYLQWLLEATKHTPRKIITTVKVAELDKDGGHRFDLPTSKLKSNLCILNTKGVQLNSQQPQRITLNLSSFGKYRISIHPILFSGSK